MSDRLQWTPLQKRIAVALLAELGGIFDKRLDHMQSVIGVFLTADGYALPLPPSLATAQDFDSIDTLGAGISELAGMIERAVIVEPECTLPAEAGPVPARPNDGTSPGHHLDDKGARGTLRSAA